MLLYHLELCLGRPSEKNKQKHIHMFVRTSLLILIYGQIEYLFNNEIGIFASWNIYFSVSSAWSWNFFRQ